MRPGARLAKRGVCENHARAAVHLLAADRPGRTTLGRPGVCPAEGGDEGGDCRGYPRRLRGHAGQAPGGRDHGRRRLPRAAGHCGAGPQRAPGGDGRGDLGGGGRRGGEGRRPRLRDQAAGDRGRPPRPAVGQGGRRSPPGRHRRRGPGRGADWGIGAHEGGLGPGRPRGGQPGHRADGGETGTGKGMVARRIHDRSPRRAGPLREGAGRGAAR